MERVTHQRHVVIDAEFAHDPEPVRRDRLHADVQLQRDLLRPHAAHHHAQHLALAGREPVVRARLDRVVKDVAAHGGVDGGVETVDVPPLADHGVRPGPFHRPRAVLVDDDAQGGKRGEEDCHGIAAAGIDDDELDRIERGMEVHDGLRGVAGLAANGVMPAED